MKTFLELSEQEILALAISLEEEDERVYADFAEGFREHFPRLQPFSTACVRRKSGHRRRLHRTLSPRNSATTSPDPSPGRDAALYNAARLADPAATPARPRAIRPPRWKSKAASSMKARRNEPRTRHAAIAGRSRQEERSHENRAARLEEEKLGHDTEREGRRGTTAASSCCRSCSPVSRD